MGVRPASVKGDGDSLGASSYEGVGTNRGSSGMHGNTNDLRCRVVGVVGDQHTCASVSDKGGRRRTCDTSLQR